MDKKLKAESKIKLRMDQLEGRVGKVEEKLQLLVTQATQTNELLVKLLEAQNSNPNDNKKGEKDELLSKPQADQPKDVQAPTVGPSNPNTEATIKPVKTKIKSTYTERHEERKRQKLTAEERRLQREAAMILEKQDQERKLADFKASIKEITEAAKAGKLKEIIEKSKKPNRSSVVEQEKEGRDEATLRLVERIRRETEQEQKLQTYVKQEPLTKE